MGVAFCLIALVLLCFVTPEDAELKLKQKSANPVRIDLLTDNPPLIDGDDDDEENSKKSNYGSINTQKSRHQAVEATEDASSMYDKINPAFKKIIGIILAFVCGVSIASSYIPILYIQNNYPNASQDQNDYAFAYNTGMFLGSLIIFAVYCVVKKNRPALYPEAILPSFASGKRVLKLETFYMYKNAFLTFNFLIF